MKKDIRSSVSYLKEKKLSDLKDELLIMRLTHLLSMKKVRWAILAGMDIVLLLGAHLCSNIVKCGITESISALKGSAYETSFVQIFFAGHSKIWYVILFFAIIVIDVKVMFMISTNYRDINRNQKGSIRWSELSEIREQYAAVPLKYEQAYETYFGKGGVPVCQYGTHYDENGKLCDIEKGIIFIDRSPVNNLLLGITRSGKGETYVMVVIDLYSRAENKMYKMQFSEDGRVRTYASNIYYDMTEGGIRKTDIPLLLREEQVHFGKSDFMAAVHHYEGEHNVKLKLPEGVKLEEDYSFFDYIDENHVKNIMTEKIPVIVADKVKCRQITEGNIEIKLMNTRIRITEKTAAEVVEYEFSKMDAKSMKDALDRAVLYLSLLRSPLEQRYDELMDCMGFALEEIQYRLPDREDINYVEQIKQEHRITAEENTALTDSDVYMHIEQEETVLDGMEQEDGIQDGILNSDDKKEDYLKLLKQTAEMNHCREFCFDRNYQASMIISDPKLELFRASKPVLELRGYDVYCLNLINPYESSNYNPLQLITDTYKNGDPAEASAIARSLASSIYAEETESGGENTFFYDNAVFLLAALIMSEVIDQLRADEEANKRCLQEHIEATKRFAALGREEKQELKGLGKELETLKRKRCREVDKYQMIVMDRKIAALEKKLKPYNYRESDFEPVKENEKKINLPNILLKFSKLAEKMVQPEVEGAEPRNALDLYFESRDTLDVARNLYSAIKISGGQRTKGSIYSTMLTKLSGFMDEKIQKMTACSSLRLQDVGFGERPIAVFMSLPEYDESNRFIQSIFIAQLYYALAKKATMCGGKCTREVIYLLDEFGNIPCIANMSRMLTVCLGRNIRFNLIVQAYSQLDTVYGENDAKTIHGNCGNQIYIMCNEVETAEKFSNLIGHETIVNVTRMGGEVSLTVQKQYTESTEENPLLKPDELMELLEGECVVKRVMMRKDLKNRNVKPRPIYNHGETAFPLRYQYMGEWFNPENKWENLHADSCAELDLQLYLSDFDKLLSDIEYKISAEYQEWYRMTAENYEGNKIYPIGEFINKEDIEKKLISQVRELGKMPREQLYDISIADIEKYYIRYESNLPAFRQRMYEISDWRRGTSQVLGSYEPAVIRFFRLALGEAADDVWELNGFEDEQKLLALTTAQAVELLEEQDVPENSILQFKTALEKYRKKGVA